MDDINHELMRAVEYGSISKIKYLVEQGADIYAQDDYILKYSAEHKSLNIVKYLIVDCDMIVKKETINYFKRFT
jgi:hypothetical protein